MFLEGGLEGELNEELGDSKYDYRNKDTDNSRNGHSEKWEDRYPQITKS